MGDTALQAGNSEAIIKKHYLNLVSPEEAEAFWKILPACELPEAGVKKSSEQSPDYPHR
jgi:hypothetical protein